MLILKGWAKNIRDAIHHHAVLIGTYLLTWWFLDILLTIWYDNPAQLLWYCDVFFPIIGLAFVLRSSLLATGVLSTSLIAQTPWVADFLIERITGVPFLGLTSYMSQYGYSLRFWVEMNHLVIIPASITAVWVFGTSKRGHLVIWGAGGLMLLLSYLLAPIPENVNCIHHFCWTSGTRIPFFPIVFSISVLLTISMMNLILILSFPPRRQTTIFK